MGLHRGTDIVLLVSCTASRPSSRHPQPSLSNSDRRSEFLGWRMQGSHACLLTGRLIHHRGHMHPPYCLVAILSWKHSEKLNIIGQGHSVCYKDIHMFENTVKTCIRHLNVLSPKKRSKLWGKYINRFIVLVFGQDLRFIIWTASSEFGTYRLCLSPMRAAKVQASLRIRAVSPEPLLLAHTSSESRGTFRQKARFLASLNGWACTVKICHDGMPKDTNLLDGAHMITIV